MNPRRNRSVKRSIPRIPALLVAGLFVVPAAEAQQSRPPRSTAQELILLEEVVARQSERLNELERALERLQAQASLPSDCHGDVAFSRAASAPDWRSQGAWNLLEKGMSEASVVAILGRPNGVQAGLTTRTLVYQTDQSGSHPLEGTVTFTGEDRLQSMREPVF